MQKLRHFLAVVLTISIGLTPTYAFGPTPRSCLALPTASFQMEAIVPTSEISKAISPTVPIQSIQWLRRTSNRRNFLKTLGYSFLGSAAAYPLSAKEPSKESVFRQAINETDILKKIQLLTTLSQGSDPALKFSVYDNLNVLHDLVGDYQDAMTDFRTILKIQGLSEDAAMTVDYVTVLVHFYAKLEQWDQAERLCRTQLTFKRSADDQENLESLLKQVFLARGDYQGFLELPPGRSPSQIEFEKHVRLLKAAWDKRGLPYLPWRISPLTDHVDYGSFLDPIGDRRRWSLRQNIPVRVYVNFSSARSTAIPFAYFLKATWNPLYQAFIRHDKTFIRTEIIEKISRILLEMSNGQCSLELEDVIFGTPSPLIEGPISLALGSLPDVRAHSEKGFSIFIGDYAIAGKDNDQDYSAYAGNGLLFLRPFEKEMGLNLHHFVSAAALPFIGAHELGHSFGMIHRFGRAQDVALKYIIQHYHHRFPPGEDGSGAIDRSSIDLTFGTHLKNITLSQLNRLRLGWLSKGTFESSVLAKSA